MTVNLANQLESILRAESDLPEALGPLAAAPLTEPAAARIRRIVAHASPAVRSAMQLYVARTHRQAGPHSGGSPCVADHKGLMSASRMVDRSLEQRGAQA